MSATTLDALFDKLDEFSAVLTEEHGALKAQDMDALTDISARKEAITTALAGLDQAMGLTHRSRDDAAGPSLSDEEQARLKSALDRCRKQNQLNGAMLEAGLTVNRTLMDILTGRVHQAPTYGKRGEMRSTGGGLALTRV